MIESKVLTYFSLASFYMLFCLLSPIGVIAETKTYNLEIRMGTNENGTANFTGKDVKFALSVYDSKGNGGIPGPTLRFTEGDDAIINVTNKTNESTSVHWHGLLLPWNMDGVPGLNTPPIEPGDTYSFKFNVRQNGTYWYHSHTGLQEQKGVYGSIVIAPKSPTLQVDYDEVIVLSDWIDEDPDQVMKNLKKEGDYYSWKKNAIPSFIGAIKEGALKDYLRNLWNRMDGMDFGDVGYDTFLINGKNQSRLLPDLKAGDRVRLRIINAGASSYFHVNLGQQMFMVISADGIDVQPVMTKELLMGMAETYDILFTVPEGNRAFELRATPRDVSGHAKLILGGSESVEMAPMKMRPSLYKMMAGMEKMDPMPPTEDEMPGMDHGDHEMSAQAAGVLQSAGMEMGMPMPMPLKYSQLKAKEPTNFPPGTEENPDMEFKITLSGDMERYVWKLNGNLLSDGQFIQIKEGSVIRFILDNQTMMNHPMHLHGHFFRVLNGQGDFAPLKHTVNVPPKMNMPMGKMPGMNPRNQVTIEFLADEPGDWFFHCHNLYHMKAGMATVVKYKDFSRPLLPIETAKIPIKEYKKMDSSFTPSGMMGIGSDGATWDIRFNGGDYTVDVEGELSEYDLDKIETEIKIKHWFGQYVNAFGGLEYVDDKVLPIAGGSLEIKLKFETYGYTNSNGDLVFGIERTQKISDKLSVEFDARRRISGESNTENETEFEFGVDYWLKQNVSIGARYINKSEDGQGSESAYEARVQVKF